MGKRACLISLKFSPGHLSHIMAFRRIFERLGFSVVLLLSKDYKRVGLTPEIEECTLFYEAGSQREILAKIKDVELAFFQNPSLANESFAKRLKKSGAIILTYYHEPWRGVEYYVKRSFKRTCEAAIVDYVTKRVLSLSEVVLVGSSFGYTLVSMFSPKLSAKTCIMPLVFLDESSEVQIPRERDFFSFVGHAYRGHAFDIFLGLVRRMYEMNIHRKLGIRFEIATPSDVSRKVLSDATLVDMYRSGILQISQGRPLSNGEINLSYSRSFCVWNAYRFTVQSGVLPKAYMFGAPVLATRIGSFPEFVVDGVTGCFVESYSLDEMLEKLVFIKKHFSEMSVQVRQFFERVFLWESNVERMKVILRRCGYGNLTDLEKTPWLEAEDVVKYPKNL